MLGRNKEACLANESTAQDTLKQNWSKYSATDQSQCVGMVKTGGPASYVELLSCLEIMRDARNIQNVDPLERDDAAVSTRRARPEAIASHATIKSRSAFANGLIAFPGCRRS